jgi:hypothetical protein
LISYIPIIKRGKGKGKGKVGVMLFADNPLLPREADSRFIDNQFKNT